MHIRTTEKTDRHIETQADRWIDRQAVKRVEGLTDGQPNVQTSCTDGQTDEWTDRR